MTENSQNSQPTPAPAQPSPAPIVPGPTKARELGNIFQAVAAGLNVVLPIVPAGTVSAAVAAGEGALRAIGEFLTGAGADNALTEAQAEKALAAIEANIKTLSQPLPTPEELEAQGQASAT